MPIKIKDYVTLRSGCLICSISLAIYRVVNIIYLTQRTELIHTQKEKDFLLGIGWNSLMLFQNVLLILAVLMEHVCLMFTVTYMEFLQLVAYNMYQVRFFTSHELSTSAVLWFVIEFTGNMCVFPMMYNYYIQLKDRRKMLAMIRRMALQVPRSKSSATAPVG